MRTATRTAFWTAAAAALYLGPTLLAGAATAALGLRP